MTAGFWHQVRAVVDRDLLRERRSGDVLWITIPFGALALLLVPLAVGTDAELLREIGVGMYWVIVMLFGVLVAVGKASKETIPQQDASSLLGLDPAAGFIGRTIIYHDDLQRPGLLSKDRLNCFRYILFSVVDGHDDAHQRAAHSGSSNFKKSSRE